MHIFKHYMLAILLKNGNMIIIVFYNLIFLRFKILTDLRIIKYFN